MLSDRGILVHATRDADGLIEVIDDADTRSLYFGTRARQSSMRLADPLALPLAYTRNMLTALLFRPQPRRILLIGLGGGSLARFLHAHLPGSLLDCVESRPAVVELARRFFQLPSHDRLGIHIGQGADFLDTCPPLHYDLILIDAFDGDGINPGVCAPAFFAASRRVLAPGGVVSTNLWASPDAALKAVLANMAAGFDGQILRLPVEERANLVTLALDRSHTRRELQALRPRAHELGHRLRLDLPQQLRTLVHHNSGLMRRLLALRTA